MSPPRAEDSIHISFKDRDYGDIIEGFVAFPSYHSLLPSTYSKTFPPILAHTEQAFT